MKKITAMLLAVMLVLSLCACGAAEEGWAYDRYMTEAEWNELSAANAKYADNYNALVDLIETNGVELDDASFAALEGIPGDIETINGILDDPSTMSGDSTARELIDLVNAQNGLVLSFIDQIKAAVGA